MLQKRMKNIDEGIFSKNHNGICEQKIWVLNLDHHHLPLFTHGQMWGSMGDRHVCNPFMGCSTE